MDVEKAIRTRRTHKVYGREPVDRATVDALLELARWAPNHHLTNPWRFRVVGPRALDRLKEAAGPEGAAKLERAPTLIVASVRQEGEDPRQDHEDLCATACAAYIVLLAAHGRGLAAYWRTPEVMETDAGRAAVGLEDDERFIALIYLGRKRQEAEVPEREPPARYVTFLD
jgi:nitroreductase